MATLRKLDLIALTASGTAADRLRDYLEGLREDAASGIAGDTIFHKNSLNGATEKNADATDLPTALVLANSLKALVNTHMASTGIQGAHAAASMEVVAAATATDQATLETLLDEIKLDYNTHLTEATVHLQNDAANGVTSADATDLATALTLANEIKADYNTHIASVMATPTIES